jgi:hypothetical protein
MSIKVSKLVKGPDQALHYRCERPLCADSRGDVRFGFARELAQETADVFRFDGT